VGFLFSAFPESDGGAHVRTPHPASCVVARAPPSEPLIARHSHQVVRANAPAGSARQSRAPAALCSEDRVRA
jgi:hypothetical protein